MLSWCSTRISPRQLGVSHRKTQSPGCTASSCSGEVVPAGVEAGVVAVVVVVMVVIAGVSLGRYEETTTEENSLSHLAMGHLKGRWSEAQWWKWLVAHKTHSLWPSRGCG